MTTAAFIALAHGRASAVSQQRHRRDFTGAVAFLAVLLQDRQNVLIEGHMFEAANAATPRKQPAIETLIILIRSCLLGIRSTGTYCISPERPNGRAK